VDAPDVVTTTADPLSSKYVLNGALNSAPLAHRMSRPVITAFLDDSVDGGHHDDARAADSTVSILDANGRCAGLVSDTDILSRV
jgi:CBS-domain-containing membrane protein